MKFCFILTQDLQSPSGLGRYYPWAKELNKLGYDVEIIALHSNYSNLRNRIEYFSKNFSVHYVSQMHVKKEQNSKSYFSNVRLLWIVFSATLLLTFSSLRSNADVYVIGKPHPMNGIAGFICKLIKKGLIIVDCDDNESNSGNFSHRWQKNIIQYFENIIPKVANFITTNTYFTLDRLVQNGINYQKIYFLSNGVDLDRFLDFDQEFKEKIMNGLKINREDLIIGYIGSMSLANHAIKLLIDAYELVVKEIKGTKLLMVGGGEDFEYLQNYIKKKKLEKNVVFAGRVSPNEVKYYYSISDITVDPVFDDIAAKARSPLKIFESLACSTPIITMDIGDRRIFSNNAQVILISEFSDDSLASELLTQLSSIRSRMSIEYNINQYTWTSLIEKFEEKIIEFQ